MISADFRNTGECCIKRVDSTAFPPRVWCNAGTDADFSDILFEQIFYGIRQEQDGGWDYSQRDLKSVSEQLGVLRTERIQNTVQDFEGTAAPIALRRLNPVKAELDIDFVLIQVGGNGL